MYVDFHFSKNAAIFCQKSNSCKTYFDSNMIQIENATLLQRFAKDYFAAYIDRSKCFHSTSLNVLFCTNYVGNVIYRKFCYGGVSYKFDGENVNVMLE